MHHAFCIAVADLAHADALNHLRDAWHVLLLYLHNRSPHYLSASGGLPEPNASQPGSTRNPAANWVS